MSGAAVEVRNVSRKFKVGGEEVWAVHDVSLKVEPGEFLALIGRSGSGKAASTARPRARCISTASGWTR